jgi:NAD(P)-dependent dehydrogenase (short-subunit alcohol dehydrogenase family)
LTSLKGKVALVTGASKGLGKAVALALAGAGAKVGLVARHADPLEAAAREAGPDAKAFTADITREEQVARLEREVRDAFGEVRILVNNAGINIRKPVTDFSLDEWNRVLETNLTSVFLMCRAFVPHMKGKGYGRILNMTSTMSHIGLPLRGAYASSKSGLLGLTRVLALELAQEGVTVNGISPGPFATEMNTVLMQDPEVNRQFLSRIPMGRWGRVEEVGQLAVYLCSEHAGFITGTDVVIDGGWCAH